MTADFVFNPFPALQIVAIAGLAALMSSAVSRIVMGPGATVKRAEIAQFRTELLKAKKQGDKKALAKLQKKQEYINKLNAELGKKTMIVLPITAVPLIIIFTFFQSFYGNSIIVMLPSEMELPFISTGTKVHFVGWYLLSFFVFSLPLQRMLGLGLTEPRGEDKTGETKTQNKKS